MTITREEWSETYLFCFVCGRSTFRCGGYDETIGPWQLITHEIVRGPHRAKALLEPSTWLRLCQGLRGGCHGEMDGCSVIVQLALKKIHDPENYDRVKVNVLRNRARDAITYREVDAAVSWLEAGTPLGEVKEKFRE